MSAEKGGRVDIERLEIIIGESVDEFIITNGRTIGVTGKAKETIIVDIFSKDATRLDGLVDTLRLSMPESDIKMGSYLLELY